MGMLNWNLRLRFVGISTSLCIVSLLLGCNGGAVGPDNRPLAPPLCSNTTGTVNVSMSPDPRIPSSLEISRVEWTFQRKCATNIPVDPNEGIGGRQGAHCEITQYVRGNTEYGGDCIGPGVSDPPASWHVGTTGSQPSNVNFNFVGTIQGNVCVSGTVLFTNGTSASFGPRLWRVQLDDGIQLPAVGYWIGATPTDPSIIQISSSAMGCPDL